MVGVQVAFSGGLNFAQAERKLVFFSRSRGRSEELYDSESPDSPDSPESPESYESYESDESESYQEGKGLKGGKRIKGGENVAVGAATVEVEVDWLWLTGDELVEKGQGGSKSGSMSMSIDDNLALIDIQGSFLLDPASPADFRAALLQACMSLSSSSSELIGGGVDQLVGDIVRYVIVGGLLVFVCWIV